MDFIMRVGIRLVAFGMLIGLLLLGVGCNEANPTIPTNSSDTISYRVIGNSISGVVLIDYSTPTSGVVSLVSNLAGPFNSGPINGFSQFTQVRPTLTVTILQSGCIEAQILVNAILDRRATSCGPGTITIVR